MHIRKDPDSICLPDRIELRTEAGLNIFLDGFRVQDESAGSIAWRDRACWDPMARLFLELEGGDQYTDAFLDMACLHGVQEMLEGRVRLHRCLRHTKKDIKAAAMSKDESGFVRLRRAELCPVITSGWSFQRGCSASWSLAHSGGVFLPAWSPTRRQQISTSPGWRSICGSTFWIARRALWVSGFGCAPMGFTTYAPSCIERCHRTVKGLRPGQHWNRDLATTILRVCEAVDGKFASGDYRGLRTEIPDPPPGLFNWKKSKRARLGEWHVDSDDEFEEKERGAPRRLGVATLSKHFDEVGAEGTYLMKTQAHTLPDGSAGAVVYILPKYTLEYAKSRRADMLSMLHLALAKSSRDVEQACASKVTGVYDINRHMYLRRTFVAVHVSDDATIVDGHKHFVEAGGFSEHAVFVKYLRSRPVRSGPASSGPGKRKRKFRHPKPKRSVALRVMLRAPASQTTVPEKGPSIEPDHDEAEEMWSVLCAPSPWMDCAW